MLTTSTPKILLEHSSTAVEYNQPKSGTRAVVRAALAQAGDRPLFLLFGVPAPHLPFKAIPNVDSG